MVVVCTRWWCTGCGGVYRLLVGVQGGGGVEGGGFTGWWCGVQGGSGVEGGDVCTGS